MQLKVELIGTSVHTLDKKDIGTFFLDTTRQRKKNIRINIAIFTHTATKNFNPRGYHKYIETINIHKDTSV